MRAILIALMFMAAAANAAGLYFSGGRIRVDGGRLQFTAGGAPTGWTDSGYVMLTYPLTTNAADPLFASYGVNTGGWNGNIGTNTSPGYTAASGSNAPSINFDGSADYAWTSDLTGINALSIGVVCMWVKVSTNSTASPTVILRGNAPGNQSYWILGITEVTDGQQQPYLSIGSNSTQIVNGHTGAARILEGQWTHVAVGQMGTNISIYINGVDCPITYAITTKKSAWFADTFGSNPITSLTLGAYWITAGKGQYLYGDMYRPCIYTNTPTAEFVSNVMVQTHVTNFYNEVKP